jgi:uncharacterized caspase-like protein
LLLLAAPAFAKDLRGVALVIGEWSYTALPALGNPENDARAMDDLLDDLGFDVTRVLDDDGDRLRTKIARFEDDAADADVALVYYSGHGFEAGGGNYIVPRDADLSTPQSAGANVVSVAALLERLAQTVPVTIVLLDACRTYAFPAGFSIQPPGAPTPLPVADTGLGEVRGPTPIARPGVAPDSLGMVIGFAAAPGQPALDGNPGEPNSPYAAALIKHMSAGGYSFGDLMTMVTEEVYLKTKARQVPWVNSSLRRVLSFGRPVEEADADEAAIKTGRRQLLMSIAAAPPETRTYVETVASNEQVPLDALFGMLEVLGVKTTDPGEIEKKIAEGTTKLKALLAAAPPAVGDDPEIRRLSDLAERAEVEGAIAKALEFRNRASQRADVLSAELDTAQDAIDTQRLALAATYAANGDTALLAFDYATAADRYGQAFDQVEATNLPVALGYLRSQADALQSLGEYGGSNSDLERAIASYRAGLARTSAAADPDNWGALQNGMGRALRVLGERESDPTHLLQSIDALTLALTVRTRTRTPFDWATTQTNLGGALTQLGGRESGPDHLNAAVEAYKAALEVRTRDGTPQDWALTMNNLGTAQQRLGERERATTHLEEAIVTYRQALEVRTRQASPYYWASTEHNLGSVLLFLGKRVGDRALVEQAVGELNAALLEWTRERVPLDWAQAKTSLGNALQTLGAGEAGNDNLLAAEAAERAALEVFTRQETPRDWAYVTDDLGWTLKLLGERTGDRAMLEAALAAVQSAWDVYRESGQSLDSWFRPRVEAIEAAIAALG